MWIQAGKRKHILCHAFDWENRECDIFDLCPVFEMIVVMGVVYDRVIDFEIRTSVTTEEWYTGPRRMREPGLMLLGFLVSFHEFVPTESISNT